MDGLENSGGRSFTLSARRRNLAPVMDSRWAASISIRTHEQARLHLTET